MDGPTELLWTEHAQEQKDHGKHEQNQNECVFSLSFAAFEFVFAVRPAELFLRCYWSGTDYTVPMLWDANLLLLGSEILGHASRS